MDSDSGRMLIEDKKSNECKQLISAVRVSEDKLQKSQDRDRKLDNVSVGNLTYLLTCLPQWSRFFLEKLIGFQLVKKFPEYYGARSLITAFTSARHLSLS